MAERIKSKGVIVLVAAMVSLTFGLSESSAADWSSVLEKIKAKYAKFEEKVKDMTILQEMEVDAPQGKMTSETKVLKKGKKSRMEIIMQASGMPEGMGGMKTIIIFDGRDTWMISPFAGKKKLSANEEKQYQKTDWWDWIPEKAKVVGTEKVGNRECYVVEIEGERMVPFTKIWLDKKNLVLVKAENEGSGRETTLLIFSDFRRIKGDWEIAYRTEIYTGSNLMGTVLVKSIRINTGLPNDLFDPNKVKVEKSNMQEMMKKMMQQSE